MRRVLALAALSALAVLTAACSTGPAEPGTSDTPRTIRVAALDSFAFTPETIPVSAGETVRFVVTNDGELEHEFVIGTHEELVEHAATMTHGGMREDTSTAIRVLSGQTKELVYTFGTATDIEFGCLVPGHYPAGMAGRFEVSP
jgi:uncharacterized cupredoxin-like copper-binding protein